jgi:hypothetical protein
MKILLLAALALAGAAVAGVVEREYKIGLSATKAPAGPVRFEIKNTGKYAHALAIAGAGVKTRTKLIQPGKTAVLLVTFKRGAYSLWCPVPGHAAEGMKAKLLTITQSGGVSPTTTSAGGGSGGTTTDGGGGEAWG